MIYVLNGIAMFITLIKEMVMENMMGSSNIMALVVMAVVYMALGSVWYSKALFADMCCSSSCKKEEGSCCSMSCYVGGFISAFVMAYVLSYFVMSMNAMDAMSGVKVGFWAWLGFIATTQFSHVLWGKKSVKHYMVDAGFYLVILLIMGGVFAVWH